MYVTSDTGDHIKIKWNAYVYGILLNKNACVSVVRFVKLKGRGYVLMSYY